MSIEYEKATVAGESAATFNVNEMLYEIYIGDLNTEEEIQERLSRQIEITEEDKLNRTL